MTVANEGIDTQESDRPLMRPIRISTDVKRSFIISWLVISAVIFTMIVCPFVLPERSIYSIAPKCEWKTKYHKECILCGMTTAFIELSRGKINAAERSNRFSLCLYSIFVLNEFLACVYLGRKLRRKGIESIHISTSKPGGWYASS